MQQFTFPLFLPLFNIFFPLFSAFLRFFRSTFPLFELQQVATLITNLMYKDIILGEERKK